MKLEEFKLNTRLKLSGLWLTLILLYIYCDIFSFHRTGYIEEMLAGYIGPFQVSQTVLLSTSLLMLIPILMLPTCLFLKANICKWLNVIISTAYTLVNLGNLIGETWTYYWLYGIIELLITSLIIFIAFKWSKKQIS